MIHRLSSMLGIFLLSAPLAPAQTSTWVPDKAHSEVDFAILHLGLSNVRGHFGNIGGLIILNGSSQLIELVTSNSTFSDSQQRLVFDEQP